MRYIATLSFFAFFFAAVNVAQAQCDCPPVADRPIVTIAAGGTGTTNWTCDNTYVIDGYVFVQDGQVLTIDAGTVVPTPTNEWNDYMVPQYMGRGVDDIILGNGRDLVFNDAPGGNGGGGKGPAMPTSMDSDGLPF